VTGDEREPCGRRPAPDHGSGFRHAGPVTRDQTPHEAFGEEFESGHDERGGRETRPPRGQRDHRDDRPDGEDAEELDGVSSNGEAVRESVDP